VASVEPGPASGTKEELPTNRPIVSGDWREPFRETFLGVIASRDLGS